MGSGAGVDALASVFDHGEIDAGFRRLDLGLGELSPMAVIQRLLDDPASMSVALHELTHLHSLSNGLGFGLTAKRYLCSRTTQYVEQAFESGSNADVDFAIRAAMAADYIWSTSLAYLVPLLEGVACFGQLAPACPDRVDVLLPRPVEHLMMFGAAIESFGGPRDVANSLVDAALESLTMAAFLRMEPWDLGTVIELDHRPVIDKYFFGHLYVRAVQERLASVDERWRCGQDMMQLLRHMLNATAPAMMTSLRAGPQHIGPGYDWLRAVSDAPMERIRALGHVRWMQDPVRFLQTGDGGAVASEVYDDLEAALDENAIKFLSGAFGADELTRLRDLAVVSQTVNFSAGRVEAVGKRPIGNGSEAIILRDGAATYLVRISDPRTARLAAGLPVHAAGPGIPTSGGRTLWIESFLDQRLRDDDDLPWVTFRLSESKRSADDGALCGMELRDGRAMLGPIGPPDYERLIRSGLATIPGLGRRLQWPAVLAEVERRAMDELAGEVREFMAQGEPNQVKIADHIHADILVAVAPGATGHDDPSRMRSNLAALAMYPAEFRDLIGCAMAGLPDLRPIDPMTCDVIDDSNQQAMGVFGTPLYERSGSKARYLGLWRGAGI